MYKRQELEPTFKQDCPLTLGHDRDNPATLTGHDWITEQSSPWNQAMIRTGVDSPGSTGHWIVDVSQAGEYTIALRRWPRETRTAITGALPAGADVPGTKAYRARPGKAIAAKKATLRIGTQQVEKRVEPEAEEVVFTLSLAAGVTQLEARFYTDNTHSMGAYYAYVERK